MIKYIVFLALICLLSCDENTHKLYTDATVFNFNDNIESGTLKFTGSVPDFAEGIDSQGLFIQQDTQFAQLALEEFFLDDKEDFSVQFWLKITSTNPMLILSQKQFSNKGLSSQKNSGWAIYSSGGTLAFNIGSGDQRLNYERDNGDKMPLSDGNWHQVTVTYNQDLSEIRLYYDGKNMAIYKVGFDFRNNSPMVIGSSKPEIDYRTELLPEIINGHKDLQSLVNEFNKVSPTALEKEDFLNLVSEPDLLLTRKLGHQSRQDLITQKPQEVNKIRTAMLENPYTVHQILELTEIKPISKIYSLENGEVKIDTLHAREFTNNVQLHPSDFAMDNLSIWSRTLTNEEIHSGFNHYVVRKTEIVENDANTIKVGVWNIWHGGQHFTVDEHGWDSRKRIAEILYEKEVDIVLMQETYSSGDYIAAELGYYFATTSDRDYRLQGSNISVISKYPILDLFVPEHAEFNNVAVKILIGEDQEIYAMSNWYGMSNFPIVYDFHEERFDQSDSIPIFFGGDFNAVPHTDGGESMASEQLLSNGFTDAYRSLHPDVQNDSAYTHNSGVRIDQLYYKGQGLINTSTEVISTWPEGFPSDHYLILSEFELN